jgi:hypothetical protein
LPFFALPFKSRISDSESPVIAHCSFCKSYSFGGLLV